MNQPEDIYQPPKSEIRVEPRVGEEALAGRGSRLGAAMIDGVLVLVLSVPLLFVLGIMSVEQFTSGEEPTLVANLLGGFIGVAIYLVLHGHGLANRGQTLGKRALGIKIVDLNGSLVPFGRLITWRYVPIWLISMVPVIGGVLSLVDVLFIFRQDRRCVHDLIAGTRVVTAR